MNRVYVGLGDAVILDQGVSEITKLSKLFDENWHLRTTADYGVAASFENASKCVTEIYLPWAGYNGHGSDFHSLPHVAIDETASLFSSWDEMSVPDQAKATALVQSILGYNCDMPCDVILHASKQYDMKIVRKIAKRYTIQLVNISKQSHLSVIRKIVEG